MNRLLGNLKRGLIFVISAPAGSGKTTLTNMLVQEFPSVVQSISYTTRPIREGELQGVHYNFVSKETFKQMIDKNDFLEHAEIYGHFYGTSLSWVENERNKGKHVVLVIDTQGARQLMDKHEASFIFIMPPSLDTLRKRLVTRSTETEVMIEQRLKWAKKEIDAGKKFYTYIVINRELKTAYSVLKSIFIAEEHRAKHYKNDAFKENQWN